MNHTPLLRLPFLIFWTMNAVAVWPDDPSDVADKDEAWEKDVERFEDDRSTS